MENSKVKLPKARYFDSGIECRIANPAMFQAAMQLPPNRTAYSAYRKGIRDIEIVKEVQKVIISSK